MFLLRGTKTLHLLKVHYFKFHHEQRQDKTCGYYQKILDEICPFYFLAYIYEYNWHILTGYN